jgi:hypothetical protein
MLIKNGWMIMNRILKPLQLKIRIHGAPAAVLLSSFVLLFGAPLYSQDLLLKEYIYLDGKLLAVERQVLTQVAQQPAGDLSKEMKFAQYSPSGIHELTAPGGNRKPGLSGIPGMQEMRAFSSPFLARFPCPDTGQSYPASSEGFKLQHGAYRRHWKITGIFEHENGGRYDGL